AEQTARLFCAVVNRWAELSRQPSPSGEAEQMTDAGPDPGDQ
ncbi:MAG: hypothetical protein RLZZ226_1630, partial [Pseudomonadota bacterium]